MIRSMIINFLKDIFSQRNFYKKFLGKNELYKEPETPHSMNARDYEKIKKLAKNISILEKDICLYENLILCELDPNEYGCGHLDIEAMRKQLKIKTLKIQSIAQGVGSTILLGGATPEQIEGNSTIEDRNLIPIATTLETAAIIEDNFSSSVKRRKLGTELYAVSVEENESPTIIAIAA